MNNKKAKKLTVDMVRNVIKKLEKAETENPFVETIKGDLIYFKGGYFLHWNDLKPRPKAAFKQRKVGSKA